MSCAHPAIVRPLACLKLAAIVGLCVLGSACNEESPAGADYTLNSSSSSGTQSGNGSGGGSSGASGTQSFTVGGSTSGLLGTGLVLSDNAGNDLAISGNGSFTFSNGVASGSTYAVTVRTQPSTPSQICTVMNGAGPITTFNVQTVYVVCSTLAFTLSANVSGLSGSGLVLQVNGTINVPVSNAGNVTLATLASGSSYAVTVATQPGAPAQTCAVANASGNVTGNVSNVSVSCTVNSYSIGGTLSGLAGSGLVLQNNGGDNLSPSANGAFTFDTALNSGAALAVTVQTQPTNPAQYCTVTNGAGNVAAANVSNIAVTCRTTGRYAFVPDYTANTLTAYSINSASGFLTPINTAATGVNPYAVAVTPSGAYVYVADSGSSDVSIFSVTAGSGALTPAGQASTGAGSVPLALTVDPSGQFVLVPDSAGGTVLVFRIDATSGALAQVPGSPFASPWTPNGFPSSIAVDPTDHYVYVTDQYVPATLAYSFDVTTGALDSPGALAYSASGNPQWISIDPTGHFLYVSDATDPGIAGWMIAPASGTLTSIAGSTFATGLTPGAQTGAIAIDPAAPYLYVTDTNNGNVVAYTINASSGALTPIGSPYATDSGPFATQTDPSGQFLYVVNSYSGTLSMFGVNLATGALQTVAGSPLNSGGTNPSSIAVW